MSQGDGAAVQIGLFQDFLLGHAIVGAPLLDAPQRLGRKCFVQLQQLHILQGHPRLVQRFDDRLDRPQTHDGRVNPHCGHGDDLRHGFQPLALTASSEATSTTAAPSLSWQALPAVTVPPSLSFLEGRVHPGEHLIGGARRIALVRVKDKRPAFAVLIADGDDLIAEAAGLDGLLCQGLGADGKLVLLLPGDALLGRHILLPSSPSDSR